MKLNSIISALVALGFGGVLWHMNGARRGAVEIVFPDDQAIAPPGEIVPPPEPIGGLDAVATVAPVDPSAPRGIRNHNPGNVRHGDDWEGLRAHQGDPEYMQFVAPFWGIRAMSRVLRNYKRKHGINTVRGVVERWAPHSENNVDAYVAYIVSVTAIPADLELDIESILGRLVPAIIHYENGQNPYSAVLITQAIGASL